MTKNEPHKEEGQEETLAERSARLEAEAAGGFTRTRKATEPPAPEEYQEPAPVAPTAAAPVSNEETEALKVELGKAKDQMMRALAEAENTRKRAAKEREDASKYAVSGFARELLSVADNLHRALAAIPVDIRDDTRIDGLIQGIEATERELQRALAKNGAVKIDPMGQSFNPNFHEVMFEVPGSGKPPGTIVQVIETGYMLHDRLLRPARVGVAKDDGSAPPTGEPGGQIDTQA
jgi:molecular chaperone GrpE